MGERLAPAAVVFTIIYATMSRWLTFSVKSKNYKPMTKISSMISLHKVSFLLSGAIEKTQGHLNLRFLLTLQI